MDRLHVAPVEAQMIPCVNLGHQLISAKDAIKLGKAILNSEFRYDLHCHSNLSDGELAPLALLERAKERELQLLAVTDHDCIDAFQHLDSVESSVCVIPGVEISCQSEFAEIHVVGVDIDVHNGPLCSLLRQQQAIRRERAEAINQGLIKAGVSDLMPCVERYGAISVSRSHFARALVENGYCKDAKKAFSCFLGKRGKVKISADWVPFERAIEYIHDAGGMAILAHPGRYPLSNRKLKLLIEAFAMAGGDALEISYPGVSPQQLDWLDMQRGSLGIMASAGSDFHFTGRPWCDLGKFPQLPKNAPSLVKTLINRMLN
jgi:hypothetical protein